MANHRFVTGMAPRERDDIFDAKELRQLAFQFSVNRLLARDNTAGRYAGAKIADRVDGA